MSDARYPYLFDVSAERDHPLSGRDAITFGGDGCAEVVVEGCPKDQWLFRLEAEQQSWFLVPPPAAGMLSLNQSVVTRRTQLDHRAIIQAGPHVFVFIEHQDSKVSSSYSTNLWLIGQQVNDDAMREAQLGATVEFDVLGLRDAEDIVVPLELESTIKLPDGKALLIGRDPAKADICLADVRVSREHASIIRDGDTTTITDLKSANGTFVNKRPIKRPTVVEDGDQIQIGPSVLVYRRRSLYPLSFDKNVELVARNLTRRVPDRKTWRGLKVILDDVSLVIRPKEFVCILGPSGSGKTTLLSALSARVHADDGVVLLNDNDLYKHFDALKQNLAVVPQRDVLHDALPLQKALRYTAKLRLPTDMSHRDIDERIDEMLDSVNLTQHQFTQIRRLSGGQTKRASWVNEAICNPSLIFVDEVTSGLDEQADYEMMSLLRRMADEGKTIICVTHSLSNVPQNCNLIVILAQGGALAFVGSPADALEYFGISQLGDVYHRLREHSPEQWKQKFLDSPFHERYVKSRMPAPASDESSSRTVKYRQPRELLTMWRQFVLLTRRYFSIKWADKRALAMMFGQSLFIAALLVWLFGDISNLDVEDEAKQFSESVFLVKLDDLLPEDQEKIRDMEEKKKRADRSSKLLFILCISCIWLGCNSAAKEIVKERSIYEKERDVGLKVISYYGSKLLLLGVLSVLQVSLLFFIVRHFTHVEGSATRLGMLPGLQLALAVNHQWLLLSLAALAGVALGLAISALSNSEDLAVTLVPICLIPQIILAGLIAPLLFYTRELSQICISSYWSYQGMLITLGTDIQNQLRHAENLDLEREWNLRKVAMILAAHVVAFSLIAIFTLYARDRKSNGLLGFFRKYRIGSLPK